MTTVEELLKAYLKKYKGKEEELKGMEKAKKELKS